MRHILNFLIITVLTCIAHVGVAFADEAGDYALMSLEELMNVKISVASNKETTINRAPAVVSLITADEIAHMGARDLTDVLRMIPGFSFHHNGFTTISTNFRGLVSSKLILIDDFRINDGLFRALQLGRRFPIDMIDRIEIMRGPGSVKYGATAGLYVVKIVTKLAKQAKSAASAQYGAQEYGTIEQKIEALLTKSGENVSGGALFSYRESGQSEKKVTDILGDETTLKGDSEVVDQFGLFRLNAGNFTGQAMVDSYSIQDQLTFGFNNDPVEQTFDSVDARLSYEYDISENFRVVPYVAYRQDKPWIEKGSVAAAVQGEFNKSFKRMEAGLNADYEWNEDLNVMFGFTTLEEEAEDLVAGQTYLYNSSKKASLDESSVFAEVYANLGSYEMTIGSRYDFGTFGERFVPRASLVKAVGTWNYKLVLAQGYRPPSIENFYTQNPGVKIRPEVTSLAEVEMTKRLNQESMLGLNIFTMSIQDPISFAFPVYENLDRIRTTGAELSYQHKTRRNSLKMTVDYVYANTLPQALKIPNEDGRFRSAPNWKATLLDTFEMHEDCFITPSIVYEGPKYSFEYSPSAAGLDVTEFDETIYANLVIERRNFLRKNLDVSIGVYNIGGEDYRYPSPFSESQPALPTQSRTYLAKVNATF